MGRGFLTGRFKKFEDLAPDDWRRNYLQRPIDKLPADITRAFDMMWKLQREKDSINGKLLEAERRLDVAGWKLWTLGLIVTGEGLVIGWLVKSFLDHLR